ncbi:MAG: hypothetical protein M1822_008680 [Bathelium mastoideum]|nr:MAG: hypothetical protein M1822_008680 [Bathelium mastoideum]
MSTLLWKAFYQDDVDSFRHILETASYNIRDRTHTQKGHGGGQGTKNAAVAGSPGSYLATSPINAIKTRKSGSGVPQSGIAALTLTRADINWKDTNGLTLLHHAATGTSERSLEFGTALLQHPLTDLYIQDLENGWTALHRAFYFGNILIALAIINRESEDSLSHGPGNPSKMLIKIKDKEGHVPFDVLGLTLRDHRAETMRRARRASSLSSEDTANESAEGEEQGNHVGLWARSLQGDEVYTFGSNKNITLGFGDEDDRHFPERIHLRRPLHLSQRFFKEHINRGAKRWASIDPAFADMLLARLSPPKPASELPAVIRSRPVIIQDVQMSKLHTAVITTDPESNLYLCGHGPGGRLGTGSEATQFSFVCVEGGALARKRVTAVALGHHHTIALSSDGEIFSWGSNGFGQLGYILPQSPTRDDEPVLTLPRQIFGPLKKEVVLGIAASRIHSVAFTSSSLYTFGKNEGQLGIVDSDARSLTSQAIPRKVAASLFSSSIVSACAIDRATVCLLENHDVWIFANYGYTKLSLALGAFTNYFLRDTFLTTRYDTMPNITKITSGGDTICALSSAGEIYTVSITNSVEGPVSNTSTTNPSKIRGALSPAHKIWSPREDHMRAKDVSVDQDGSIILTTEAGSAWRRTRRAKIKDASASGTGEYQPKNYKFSRIPGLTRVIAVRASGYGAYAAVRSESGIIQSSTVIEDKTLWKDLLPLLPFYSLASSVPDSDSEDENPPPRFWQGSKKKSDVALIKQRILESSDLEKDMLELQRQSANDPKTSYDVMLSCTASDVRVPVHSFLACSRSKVIRHGLAQFQRSGFFTIPDVLSIEYDKAGDVLVQFTGLDFLSLANFVLYLYTDNIVDFWHHTRRVPKLAFRYRQIRTELMRLAVKLDMPELEPAVRQMIEPKRSLDIDLEWAFREGLLEATGDIIVQLEDAEVRVLSALVCRRCPFFEGLFNGRAHGKWLDDRRRTLTDETDAITVDLKHIEPGVFEFVLRHIYADTGEELFDDVVSDDFDDFIDLVIDVMGVANELMLDRLSQICQKVIGRYVTARNVASLLNATAPSAVSQLKDAGLEYLSMNLEAVLENSLLNELDVDLLEELDEKVKDNQRETLKYVRSDMAFAKLLERFPELPEAIRLDKQARIDNIMIQAKHFEGNSRLMNSVKSGSVDELQLPSLTPSSRRKSSKGLQPMESPEIEGKLPPSEMLFDMEDEAGKLPEAADKNRLGPRSMPSREGHDGHSPLLKSHEDIWFDSKGKPLSSSQDFPGSSPFANISPLVQSTATATNIPQSPDLKAQNAPWGAAPLNSSKLGLKEIMDQASASRTSNISLALSTQSKHQSHGKTAAQPGSKVSQKDRKKLQQVQQPVVAPVIEKDVQAPEARSSAPWQVATRGPKVALKDVIGQESKAQPGTSDMAPTSRNPSAPPLTMRQTIANPAATASSRTSPKNQLAQPPVQSRSVSSPQSLGKASNNVSSPLPNPKTPPSRSSPMPVSVPFSSSVSATPPAIRSISHLQNPLSTAARAAEPSLGLSMSEIVLQQQAEKDIVREVTTAKRSLQEIQREQEFQEWWDKESRKMQGLDEDVDEDGGAEGSGRRGDSQGKGRRGGGRGRGKGRKGENARTSGTHGVEGSEAPAQKGGDKGRRNRRGRGDGRRIASNDQN